MKVKEVWALEPLAGAPPQNGVTVCPVLEGPAPCKDCRLVIGGVAHAACHESYWVDSDTRSDLENGARVESVTEIAGMPLCRHPKRWRFLTVTAVAIGSEKV